MTAIQTSIGTFFVHDAIMKCTYCRTELTPTLPKSRRVYSMAKAIFRFYEELNDFLPEHRRKTDFEAPFTGKRSIKDMVESLGVPHTEIDLILVNGISVGFDYILQDKDRVSVYPVFESLNITDVTRLRKIPLRRNKFIADINLGDIVKYMRVLGLDVYYDTFLTNREIIEISNTKVE